MADPSRMKRLIGNLLMVVACLVGFGCVYFLSSGPVARLTRDTAYESAVEDFYSPLLDLTGTPVGFVGKSYLRFWGVYFEGGLGHPVPIPSGWIASLRANPALQISFRSDAT